MVKAYKYCTSPSNKDIKIWRYMDFPKFVDLLTSESLFFSRCDKFEDLFEGSIPLQGVYERKFFLGKCGQENPSSEEFEKQKHDFYEKIKENFAANCWHINEHESVAMWKIFLNSNSGVAIQSTYSRLHECFNTIKNPIYLSIIQYKDFDSNSIDWNWGNYINRLLHKRCHYSFEQELRAIIRCEDGFNFDEGGAKLSIDINSLIENIYISPSSPKWFSKLVNQLIEDYKFKFNIINSQLDNKPIY